MPGALEFLIIIIILIILILIGVAIGVIIYFVNKKWNASSSNKGE